MAKRGANQLERKTERAQKLAQALRDNLRRRKAAAGDPVPNTAPEPEHAEPHSGKPRSGPTGD